MKRMLTAMLVCVLLLTALPAMAADNVRTSGDFQYTIKGNGTATIVGYTGENTDIILPNLIDGYTITTIGANAFACEEKQSQKISVTLPNTTTSIEEKAFANRNITSINIPDTVEYIGCGAFLGSNEVNFRLANNHPNFATIDGALYNKAKKELLHGHDDATIPEGIVSIGDYACFGGIKCGFTGDGYSFPSTLQRIGDYAYANGEYYFSSESDNELYFPEYLTYIGNYAFADNYIATYIGDVIIHLPASLEFLGEAAFRHQRGDTDIKYVFHPETKLDEIGAYAFADDNGENHEPRNNVIMNGSVEEIGSYSFFHTKVSGNFKDVEEIGEYAFATSWYKEAIIIPATCETIGAYAFENCIHAKSLTIENGVEEIESNAFSGMKIGYAALNDLSLPESLEKIADDAFDKNVSFVVNKGSYAERWAKENAYPYTINGEEQNLDWLNN